jgi:hypothetical protein
MNRHERRKREREERRAARTGAPPDTLATVEQLFDPDTAAALRTQLGADADGGCRGIVLKVRL